MKLKVLFKGWINVPHSYAIVNCFQLIHLVKNYSDRLEIYVQEMEYYNPKWNLNKKLVYPKEYCDIIKKLKIWNGETVDLVYSITYPYNVEPEQSKKIVFYTSEFGKLSNEYFKGLENNNFEDYLKTRPDLYFTSPSIWSQNGLKGIIDKEIRNKVITHGVDLSIFKKDVSKRDEIRKRYGITKDDIVLINIGAMTKNKGITLMIQALHYLKLSSDKSFKLILKGSGDLYECQKFLQIYMKEFSDSNVIPKEQLDVLFKENIIFIDKSFSYSTLNDIYNACDLYISPYLAEGFNLTPLEALASGLPVMVPRTGSTKEYMRDIYQNYGNGLINYLKSKIVVSAKSEMYNYIELEELVEKLLQFEPGKFNEKGYLEMRNYIEKEYSWNKVSHLLYKFFDDVKNEN